MLRNTLSFTLFFGLIVALVSLPARGSLIDQEELRRNYLTALAAVKAGNIERYRVMSHQLEGYILRGYLDYEYLKDRIDTTPAPVLRRFLEENTNAPISDRLRKKWLRHLAGRGDWKTFLIEYRDVENDPELLCLRLTRLLRESEQQAALMQEIEQLWLTERRLPQACEPVFSAWKKAGHMTNDKVWERIRLAMENRNLRLARDLTRHLDRSDRSWVYHWLAMHRDPMRELQKINYRVETPVARMIIRHGIVRLAYRDPEAAMLHWRRLNDRYQFFGEDENYVLRNVGILAAQDHLPVALEWLAAVSADAGDETLHTWRIKAALRARDWETANRFIAGLPDDQKELSQWRYWKARILEVNGAKREAESIYTLLSRERDYYGFMAADRINAAYSMQHVSVDATPYEINTMLVRPGIRMARELYALGRIVEARRQWRWTTHHMNNRELQVAAVLAREWGWYDRAILTVSRSDHLDDLELRFPVLYRDEIEANAEETGIDPGWIYGVVRQESAFVADARSPAGALGLMQLLPSTGRRTGRQLNLKIHGRQALLNIETNLRLGANYLKTVLDRHEGHQVLATAAYNAGPHRVSRWLPPDELDADVWVETIPFNETRGYVKNVMAYTAVYDHRLGLEAKRLRLRMPTIVPSE
jgi:soluble lytic murein transglycosylase